MSFAAALPIAGAILGGLAGGQGSRTSTSRSFVSDVQLKDINELNKGRSALEASAAGGQVALLTQLRGLVGAGAGQQDVTGALGAQRSLADLLQSQIGTSGRPDQSQILQAQQFARDIFAPQQTALQQSFGQQDIAQQRLAARLGRGGADPILRAKLGQEQTRQQQMLQSQMGAFGAEQAQMAPQRQIQLSEALANVRGGLASQAFQNRQTLMQMGQQLAESERQYRLGTARKTDSSTETESGGGGLAGAISGGLVGAGAGAELMGKFGTAGATGGERVVAGTARSMSALGGSNAGLGTFSPSMSGFNLTGTLS